MILEVLPVTLFVFVKILEVLLLIVVVLFEIFVVLIEAFEALSSVIVYRHQLSPVIASTT